MEENKKNYYSIKEVSALKGISEEDIFCGIREGRIKTKQIGMNLKIPADVLDEIIVPLSAEKIDQYMEQLHPHLVSMLQSMPKYGSAGILITLHDLKIVKVGCNYESTKLENNYGRNKE